MAISIITKVWDYPHLRDQSQLLVMLALADYSNDQGESFPRVDTLAEKARISERHVQKILSHLQVHGLLTIERGAGKGSRPGLRTNLYRIDLAKLSAGEPIPAPLYKQSKKRSLRGGIMTPLKTEVAYEEHSPRESGGGTMPPKTSVREPSKRTTTASATPPAINGNGAEHPKRCRFSLVGWEEDSEEEIADKLCGRYGESVGDLVVRHLREKGAGYVKDSVEAADEWIAAKEKSRTPVEKPAAALTDALNGAWKPKRKKEPKKRVRKEPPVPEQRPLSFEQGLELVTGLKESIASVHA